MIYIGKKSIGGNRISIINEENNVNDKSQVYPIKITAGENRSNWYSAYRTTCLPLNPMINMGWIHKGNNSRGPKSVDLTFEPFENFAILYKPEDINTFKVLYKDQEPEFSIDDVGNETLNIFRDWFITQVVRGYKGVKINCRDSLIVKEILEKFISQIDKTGAIEKYEVLEDKKSIEIIFHELRVDFKNQVKICLDHFLLLLHHTSDIITRICSNRRVYTMQIFGYDDKVDFSNWCIWRNVYLALLNKSYIIRDKNPTQLAFYSAYAKTIERAADNCAGLVTLANDLCYVSPNAKMKQYIENVLTGVSKLLKEIEITYQKASIHFMGDDKVKLEDFKIKYNCPCLNELEKIFDTSKLPKVFSETDPEEIAKIWKIFGQMYLRMRRLIEYPYNIMLWDETGAVHLQETENHNDKPMEKIEIS